MHVRKEIVQLLSCLQEVTCKSAGNRVRPASNASAGPPSADAHIARPARLSCRFSHPASAPSLKGQGERFEWQGEGSVQSGAMRQRRL